MKNRLKRVGDIQDLAAIGNISTHFPVRCQFHGYLYLLKHLLLLRTMGDFLYKSKCNLILMEGMVIRVKARYENEMLNLWRSWTWKKEKRWR